MNSDSIDPRVLADCYYDDQGSTYYYDEHGHRNYGCDPYSYEYDYYSYKRPADAVSILLLILGVYITVQGILLLAANEKK